MVRAPRLARLALVLVAALCVPALSACGSDGDAAATATTASPDLAQALSANDWTLDAGASSPAPAGSAPVTLSFAADDVSGNGGCNQYRGTMSLDAGAGTIAIDGLAQTQKACADDVMRAEDAYLAALGAVRDVALTGDGSPRLVLSNDAGDRLEFDGLDPSALIVGTWQVTGVAQADAIHSAVAGTDPQMTFGEDGALNVTTGCNMLRTAYTLDGDSFAVEPIAGTRKMCSEPEGVMEQESAIAAALEASVRAELTPSKLTLLDSGGLIQLVAVPEATP